MATSVWRGYITFGLISIPVQLFKAARSERIALKQVYRLAPEETAGQNTRSGVKGRGNPASETAERMAESIAPVRRVASSGEHDEILPETKVLKGFEFDKGRFVTIDAEDLKALEAETAKEMEVLEFVRLDAVDPVYFETSYYVRPEPAGEKPFALLYEAPRCAELVAVARFAMHRREHVTLIRSGKRGLVAHTMFYSSEVRAGGEYKADASLLSEKELKLADTLVRSLAAEFEPEKYHDSYKEKLERLIASKVAGKAVAPAAPARGRAPVVDIMEALQASLTRLRKPPGSAAEPAAARTRKRTKAG